MSEKPFNSIDRSDLALAYLARANEGGTAMRSILLGFASAAIGFVFHRFYDDLFDHWPSIVGFGAGAGFLVVSWDVQKRKAIERFNALRHGGSDADLDVTSNLVIDRLAAVFIVAGLVWEFLLAVA